MSASLPGSGDPTRGSTRSCLPGLIVTSANASSSDRPPHFIDFAASVLRRRASSALSELTDVSTPFLTRMAALYGIASAASTLYAHQSENADAPAPCAAISFATL